MNYKVQATLYDSVTNVYNDCKIGNCKEILWPNG